MAELRKRGLDDVKLLVVGELQENIHPGSSAEFAAVVDETGLAGRLVRTGFVPDVRPYLSLADVVAVPSDFEPFGRIVIESLALERPVVAAASGGIPEIITDGVDGLLIPPGDHPALADALERLLGSPQTARRLATAGRRMVLERFTMERNQRKLCALVRRLTD